MSPTLPSLETERLVLRPFTLADAPDVHRAVGNWAIADTTLNIPHPYAEGMAEMWIGTHAEAFATGENLTLAITSRASGALLGAIGLALKPEHARGEMGYWVAQPFWGRGYCTEAAAAVLRYAFEMLGLNRVHAAHLTRNPASGRVMQKLGMTHEGRRREHYRKWGVFEDVEEYGILRQEWDG